MLSIRMFVAMDGLPVYGLQELVEMSRFSDDVELVEARPL